MNKLLLTLLSSLMISSVLAIVNTAETTRTVAALKSHAEKVSPQEAAELQSERRAIIVDVREDDEWQKQHILGAIHIPMGQLSNRFSELAQYKQTPVITQCRSGSRSKNALTVLKTAGFKQVYNLDGGLIAWDKAGLKTESDH